MTKSYPYPDDEFDATDPEGSPHGAHRARRSKGRGFLVALLVIVLAAALGYSAATFLPPLLGLTARDVADSVGLPPIDDSDTETTTPATPTTDETTDDAGSDDAGAGDADQDSANDDSAGGDTPTDDETDSEDDSDAGQDTEPDEEPVAELDKAIAVRVLNATRTQGLAARGSTKLGAEGWTNLATANYSGSAVNSSLVLYKSAEYQDEAAAIADALGISAVREAPDIVGPVSVILAGDFRP